MDSSPVDLNYVAYTVATVFRRLKCILALKISLSTTLTWILNDVMRHFDTEKVKW